MTPKHLRGLALLALVLLASVAAAAALTVQQRTDTATLYAERYSVPGSFVLAQSILAPAPAPLGALGAPGAPVELAATNPDARTPIARDHWTYSVLLQEKDATAVASGEYAITLKVDNAARGVIHVKQADPQTSLEGARLHFDLGPSLAPDALYFLEVRPFVPVGPTVTYTVKSVGGASPTWAGVGGSIQGVTNATLTLALGSTLQLVAQNDDGGFHNLALLNGAAVIDPPGASGAIPASGSVQLAWVPQAAGSYHYVCQYHPATMKGQLIVTA